MSDSQRIGRWYFGGLASAGATLFTHPLDLIKVHLQTQQENKVPMVRMTLQIIKRDGAMALYSGLSASLCRQLSYSMMRFAVYETGKKHFEINTFASKVGLAAVGGAMGGIVGTPADMVNVRMQNDVKLAKDKRRNYKHAIDGLIRVYKEEGVHSMFRGVTTATGRAIFMTIGQVAFYDQVKVMLLSTGYFRDNPLTHFLASLMAGAAATALTQPLDVLKTRSMNAKPGEYKNLGEIIMHTAKLGPKGFFKGFVPAFVRLGPHTILTFVFLEQLRLNFGYLEPHLNSN